MNTTSTFARTPSRFALRLCMCAASLAAMAAPMSSAHAVVVTTFANTSIAIPANADGIYLNLLTGATGSSGGSVSGWDINPYLQNAVFTFFWNNTLPSVSGGVATAVSGGVYSALAPGATVNSSSIFSASSGGGGPAATVNFQTVGTHVLGFRFYNEATSAINYGYMSINNGPSAGFPATITGWTYENTGAAISVTAVPEPTTGALLAMGALALGALNLRRQRRAQGQAQS